MDEKALEPRQLILVSFYDPRTIQGWSDALDCSEEKPSPCTVVGWIIREDRDFLRIGSLKCDEDDSFNNRTIIAKGSIAKRTVLKEGDGTSPHS